MKTKKVTIHTLNKMKNDGDKITMLTAYDATFATLLDESQIDVLLVGDSLGMVIQGHETTLPVTLDEIIYHCKSLARGTRRAHIVGDMPFMSYQSSIDEAMLHAGRLVKEGGAHSVKLEGGAQHADLIRKLVSAGIPVMGHLGLTPQSVHQMGGFKVQGRGDGEADAMLQDALTLQEAGAFSIVLEGIPNSIAKTITERLSIPTIGIGAGPDCDGQVLVVNDLLGLDNTFKPRFVKRYASLQETMVGAIASYADEVRTRAFPDDDHSFGMKRGPAKVAKLY